MALDPTCINHSATRTIVDCVHFVQYVAPYDGERDMLCASQWQRRFLARDRVFACNFDFLRCSIDCVHFVHFCYCVHYVAAYDGDRDLLYVHLRSGGRTESEAVRLPAILAFTGTLWCGI